MQKTFERRHAAPNLSGAHGQELNQLSWSGIGFMQEKGNFQGHCSKDCRARSVAAGSHHETRTVDLPHLFQLPKGFKHFKKRSHLCDSRTTHDAFYIDQQIGEMALRQMASFDAPLRANHRHPQLRPPSFGSFCQRQRREKMSSGASTGKHDRLGKFEIHACHLNSLSAYGTEWKLRKSRQIEYHDRLPLF